MCVPGSCIIDHMQERCCVIDRCNSDADQRAPWIRIAAQRNVPCYGLWMNLPKHLVCERASQRTQHEGGLVGATAGRLACQMHHKLTSALAPLARCCPVSKYQTLIFGFTLESCAEDGGPSLFEGFEHIIIVTDDSQVEHVLRGWKAFSPASLAAHDVLSHLKPVFQPSAFLTKASGKFPVQNLSRPVWSLSFVFYVGGLFNCSSYRGIKTGSTSSACPCWQLNPHVWMPTWIPPICLAASIRRMSLCRSQALLHWCRLDSAQDQLACHHCF